MAAKRSSKPDKKVTRYTYDDIKEPRTPETGHTSLLPAEEQVVTLPMDNGWSKAIRSGWYSPSATRRPVCIIVSTFGRWWAADSCVSSPRRWTPMPSC